MVDEYDATASFKRTFLQSGPQTGWQTAWLQFDLPATPPDNFREWCESLPGVMSVKGSFDPEHPNRYTLYFDAFNDATALMSAIIVIINATSKKFGYKFEVDNQGVHTPPPRIRDDQHMTSGIKPQGATVFAPLVPYEIRQWRQRKSPPQQHRTPWRTWLRQSARWVGWWLLYQVFSIFVVRPLKIAAMIGMIRKARRHR